MKLPRPLTEPEIAERFPKLIALQSELRGQGADVEITVWEEDGEAWEFNPIAQNAKIDRAMARAIKILDHNTQAYLEVLKVRHPRAWDELASLAYGYGSTAMLWALRALIRVKKSL